MSAKVCGLIWEVGPKDRSQRFVLLAIGDNAGDDGYAYPGIALLANKTLFTERYVMDAIQRLETDGWLRVERKAHDGKGNHYYIDVEKLEELKGELRSREKSSRELRSREKQRRSQVKSKANSGEIHDNPPHPLIGRTVNEPSMNQEPDTADTRILCEELGIFRIKEQEEVNRMYRVFCQKRKLHPIAGREYIKRRWGEYQAFIPKMEWTFSSPYSFLMSGTWDNPDAWPKRKSEREKPKLKFDA